MARAGLLALLCALAGCGPTVVELQCVSLMAQEVNEAGVCLGPPVTPTGLTVCPTTAFPSGEQAVVCLVDPDTRIYRASIAPSARLQGAGWTHSAYAGGPSTLSPADTSRCDTLLPADAGAPAPCQ